MIGENSGAVTCEGRDGAISVIRFISMLSIILCHFLQYYGNELAWWFNVGVQVFFVMSGFLYAEKTIEDPLGFLFKTFKKILIPYYAVLVVVVALYLLFVPEEIVVINVIKAFFCVGAIKGMNHLWFVGYILVCYLITPYLYRLRVHLAKYSFKIDCFACLLLCGITQILGYLLDSYFRPDRIACYILGYFISYFYRKYGDRALQISGTLFFVVSLGSNSLRVFLKYIHPVNWRGIYATGFQVFEMYSHLALGVSIFLLLYLLLRGGVQTAFIPVLRRVCVQRISDASFVYFESVFGPAIAVSGNGKLSDRAGGNRNLGSRAEICFGVVTLHV